MGGEKEAPGGFAPGATIAGYEVLRPLGAGGMGVVVAARRIDDGATVAIKVPTGKRATDPRVTRRLTREARALGRVDSPHVAKVLDVGELEDGTPFLVMELLEGEDLARLLAREGPMAVPRAVGYLLEACAGVASAHAAGVIHRDIKPSNLFLTKGSARVPARVKLLDFGLSRAFALGGAPADDSSLTASDAVVGSPRYLAPEVVRDAHAADERSDVWSLGVVLYELVTGRRPFDAPTMAGVLARIVTEPPTPLTSHLPNPPESLGRALTRALEKDPARRTASVRELEVELRSLIAPAPPRRARFVARHTLLVAAPAAFVAWLAWPPTPPAVAELQRGLSVAMTSRPVAGEAPLPPAALPTPAPKEATGAVPRARKARAPEPTRAGRDTAAATAALAPSAWAFGQHAPTPPTIETRK